MELKVPHQNFVAEDNSNTIFVIVSGLIVELRYLKETEQKNIYLENFCKY